MSPVVSRWVRQDLAKIPLPDWYGLCVAALFGGWLIGRLVKWCVERLVRLEFLITVWRFFCSWLPRPPRRLDVGTYRETIMVVTSTCPAIGISTRASMSSTGSRILDCDTHCSCHSFILPFGKTLPMLITKSSCRAHMAANVICYALGPSFSLSRTSDSCGCSPTSGCWCRPVNTVGQ